MFENRPESYGLKFLFTEIVSQEIAPQNRNPFGFGVIERRAGDICAQDFISAGKLLAQLIKKCAGRTAHIQNRAGLAVLAEKSQLAFEAHSGIIAFEFCRRKVILGPIGIVILARSELGRNGICEKHRATEATNNFEPMLFKMRLRFGVIAHRAISEDLIHERAPNSVVLRTREL